MNNNKIMKIIKLKIVAENLMIRKIFNLNKNKIK